MIEQLLPALQVSGARLTQLCAGCPLVARVVAGLLWDAARRDGQQRSALADPVNSYIWSKLERDFDRMLATRGELPADYEIGGVARVFSAPVSRYLRQTRTEGCCEGADSPRRALLRVLRLFAPGWVPQEAIVSAWQAVTGRDAATGHDLVDALRKAGVVEVSTSRLNRLGAVQRSRFGRLRLPAAPTSPPLLGSYRVQALHRVRALTRAPGARNREPDSQPLLHEPAGPCTTLAWKQPMMDQLAQQCRNGSTAQRSHCLAHEASGRYCAAYWLSWRSMHYHYQ